MIVCDIVVIILHDSNSGIGSLISVPTLLLVKIIIRITDNQSFFLNEAVLELVHERDYTLHSTVVIKFIEPF